MNMRVGYVVLYINDVELCRQFWIDHIGMIEKDRKVFGEFIIVQVGFADQPFSFELVPLALMADNPNGLDLATPSIALNVDDLAVTRTQLMGNGVTTTEIGDHGGVMSFAFCDPEGRWFAVTE